MTDTDALAPAHAPARPDLLNLFCLAGVIVVALAGLGAAALGVPLSTITAISAAPTAVLAAAFSRGGAPR